MDSGSEEESVLDVGEEQLCGEDLEVDAFAETLKLMELKAEIKLTSNCWTNFAAWLYHSLSLLLFVSCTIGGRSEMLSLSRLPISLQVKGWFNQASSKQTS